MKKAGSLLIVDDNKSVLDSLQLFLKRKFEEVIICSNPNQIPNLLSCSKFDVVLLDMNFSTGINNGNEGLFWLKEILKIDSTLVVIFFTAYAEVNLAVNAMKYGATDFILKPWDNKKLLATLKSGVELHQTRQKVECLEIQKQFLEQDLNQNFEKIIGDSQAMKPIFETIRKVANTDANVLILGENGTGKELVARELHLMSGQKNNIFMGVDLGSLSESIFESELFGHVKGAFTDAKEDRMGRFQSASGGSLFLDEIGNLSSAIQAKLLAALQNRKVTPLGSNREDHIDIRLICATNQNIKEMVKTGDFREDLLYRINTIQIELPPLRNRGNDIITIAEHFLKRYADKYGKAELKLRAETKDKLLSYLWPGNIRELRHCMERAVILNDKEELNPEDFLLETQNTRIDLGGSPISLDEAEQLIIANSLKRNQGNISHVAKELNIGYNELFSEFDLINKSIENIKIESENRNQYFKVLVEHVGVGLVSFNEKGKVFLFNGAAKEIFNKENLFHIQHLDRIQDGISSLILGLEPSEQKLISLFRNHEMIQLSVKATKLKIFGENLSLVSFQNIKNELDDKELDSWQKLIRVLTHEIMNSISPINSSLSTLIDFYCNEDTDEQISIKDVDAEMISDTLSGLKIIDERIKGMLDFVQRFRNIAIIPKPNIRFVDIRDRIVSLSNLFSEKFRIYGIEFSLICSEKKVDLNVDPVLLDQIIINLLTNSIQAVQGKDVKLITLRVGRNEEESVFIDIEDNGSGIEKELQEEVFVPFFTTKENGSGVGLSLSRQLMRLHGGTISFKSIPNKQTLFRLQF